MTDQPDEIVHAAVPCPFCGLVCDDLEVRVSTGLVKVAANGCPRSVALFEYGAAVDGGQAFVEGRPATLEVAVGRAAQILRAAAQPVIGGLATDVAGMRAALDLADRIGAVVDHANSRALMRNLPVLQDSGWIATTFAEVRNRADLVVVAGSDVVHRFPRFFERVLRGESMFVDGSRREVIFVGEGIDATVSSSAKAPASRAIPCRKEALGEVFAVLRSLLAGRKPQAAEAGGIGMSEWEALAERMKRARYGVVVWAAADLDFPHAELAVQAMAALVTDLNEHTRFAVLPLGGSEGDLTANQVCTWQSGFPLRTSFASGAPDYDPHRFSAQRMFEDGEADALLWIASFDPERVPPRTAVPTVVLGRPGMHFAAPPAVYIPAATPGMHHAGHFYRSDNVVALRLRKVADSALPSVADVLQRIGAEL